MTQQGIEPQTGTRRLRPIKNFLEKHFAIPLAHNRKIRMKNEQVVIEKYHIFQKVRLAHFITNPPKNLDFFQVHIPQN